jgi:putative acetyltransferase
MSGMTKIRTYQEGDLEPVLACFDRSVREIGRRTYAPEQVEAWASGALDRDRWAERLGRGGVFIAEREGSLAGFSRIEEDGYLDLLYVDPRQVRRGVARELLRTAQSFALHHGAHRLESEVSIAARPFFEAMGFQVEEEQIVERSGIRLKNFRMARPIGVTSTGSVGTAPAREEDGVGRP